MEQGKSISSYYIHEDYEPNSRAKALEIAMGPEARDLMGIYFQERKPTLIEKIDGLIESQGGKGDFDIQNIADKYKV